MLGKRLIEFIVFLYLIYKVYNITGEYGYLLLGGYIYINNGFWNYIEICFSTN